MVILKVKEWIKNPLAQFKVELEYDGIIRKVIRLSDGRKFELHSLIGYNKDGDGAYYITKFHTNLMQVDYTYIKSDEAPKGTCGIDSIEIAGNGRVTIKTTMRRPRRRVSAKKSNSNDSDSATLYSL